ARRRGVRACRSGRERALHEREGLRRHGHGVRDPRLSRRRPVRSAAPSGREVPLAAPAPPCCAGAARRRSDRPSVTAHAATASRSSSLRAPGDGVPAAERTDEVKGRLSRRRALGGSAAVAAPVVGGEDVSAEAQEAAAAVGGVTSAALEQEVGSRFQRLLRGRIEIAESGREAGLSVYDEAMRAVVTVVHDRLDDQTARRMQVGGITGVLADGTELDALELDPDMPVEDPRLDRVSAGAFYARYGLG